MLVLIIGHYGSDHVDAIRAAIRRALTKESSYSIQFIPSIATAKDILSDSDTDGVKCIFLDGTMSGVQEFIPWIRGQETLLSVPIFALVSNICDQVFRETNSFGVDDTLGDRDMGAITRRMAVFLKFNTLNRPPITQGNVVLAHANIDRRRLMGRILRNAGYNLIFAGDLKEITHTAKIEESPKILVVSLDLLSEEPLEKIEEIRHAISNVHLPFILIGKEPQLSNLATELCNTDTVELMSEDAPSDNLLFLTNELLRRIALREKNDQRASARLLYGTLCAFRYAGNLSSVYGYCYNISNEGMYIKSCDAPKIDNRIWLEMIPPGEIKAIHLRCNVVWVCLPDNSKPAATPPGFGLRIDENACPPDDLEKYRAAYAHLLSGKHL